MIVESAYHRKESRGVHFTVDYPQKRNTAKDTLIRKSVMSDVINSENQES
jgi:aspartate oxidase